MLSQIAGILCASHPIGDGTVCRELRELHGMDYATRPWITRPAAAIFDREGPVAVANVESLWFVKRTAWARRFA